MGAYQLQLHRGIHEAIRELNSLVNGEGAVERIVFFGRLAVPHLEHFLLDCPPRTIAVPRCRAVRALAELGAYSVLTNYFKRYERPADSAILFAEDAVRSAAAHELAQFHSDEVYGVLLDAARQRATSGLIQALGSFRRCESVPLLFDLLEDDLCRADAITELLKVPEAAQPYAILFFRRCTSTPIEGSSALRRRRSALQLLTAFGIAKSNWPEIRRYLRDDDLDCVIAAARIGLSVVPESATAEIVEMLIESSPRMNWAQEMEATELLDERRAVAVAAAKTFARLRRNAGMTPNWLSPFWRILHHLLGSGLHLSGDSYESERV